MAVVTFPAYSEALWERGVENRLEEEKCCFGGSVFFADIYIPASTGLFEGDGSHHLTDPVRVDDAQRTSMLRIVVSDVRRVQKWEVRADVWKVAQEIVDAIAMS